MQTQQQIFESWLDQHKALLFKVIRVYAFTAEDRDDLFQEITIQVWRSIPKFKAQSAVSTWLYRISLNTALKWTSRERKHQEREQPLDGMEQLLQATEQQVDERLDWLYSEIAQLHEVDRSLTLLLLDGFSYKEMAKILGISESNVGVKINRIKKYLITQSEKYDHHGV